MKLISKTDFILYRECPNNTWVKIHNPEQYSKFEVSDFEKSLGVMGNEVEELARGIFPTGVMVEGRGEDAQKLTKELIAKRTPVIFQAVFATDKFLAATDVLQWNEEAGAYDMSEIKMSSTFGQEEGGGDDEEEEEGKPRRVNKKKELQYEYDLSFQVNVLEACGVRINDKYLIRLNKEFRKCGPLSFKEGDLFIKENKTDAVDKLVPVAHAEMEQACSVLSSSKAPESPCPCYYKGRSSHCTAFTYINPQVPKYSVHDLNRIGLSKAYLKELLDDGILTIDKVPEDDRLKPKKAKAGDPPKKPIKLNQVQVYKSGEPLINKEAIRAELNSLTYPLYFLDYETYPTAIPMFDGYHPYQHIVFQYSLHVLESKDAELKHYEFLSLEGDPAEEIVESLRKNIGKIGTIISWYKKFENSRNKDLARLVPVQYEFLYDVINRTYDLMDIVENQHYVHPGFMGRSSIKKVLPTLAPGPEHSYKELGVQNGTDAIEAYRQISKGELVGEEAEEKKREMLEYCKLDTKAMHTIWRHLWELVEN